MLAYGDLDLHGVRATFPDVLGCFSDDGDLTHQIGDVLVDATSAGCRGLRSFPHWCLGQSWLRLCRVVRAQEGIHNVLATLSNGVENTDCISHEHWVNYIMLKLLNIFPLNHVFFFIARNSRELKVSIIVVCILMLHEEVFNAVLKAIAKS